MIFCTYFDSNYLDKGIALIESLEKVCAFFRIYIFAIDKKAKYVLSKQQYKNAIIVDIKDVESPDIIFEKNKRTPAEYCWMLTPIIIKYVLEKYSEPHCTYVDADLYFFNSPESNINMIIDSGADVSLVEHRLGKGKKNRILEKKNGRYCVEYNFFRNTTNGINVLNWWGKKCMESTSLVADGEVFGDQKYLDKFELLFDKVLVNNDMGIGIAPWNIGQYKKEKYKLFEEEIRYKHTTVTPIFFHFHQLEYIDNNTINIHVHTRKYGISKQLVKEVYLPYLKKISEIRKMLKEQYSIEFMVSRVIDHNRVSFVRKIYKLIKSDPWESIRYRVNLKKDIIHLKEL